MDCWTVTNGIRVRHGSDISARMLGGYREWIVGRLQMVSESDTGAVYQ